jgi:hypothetical protein
MPCKGARFPDFSAIKSLGVPFGFRGGEDPLSLVQATETFVLPSGEAGQLRIPVPHAVKTRLRTEISLNSQISKSIHTVG